MVSGQITGPGSSAVRYTSYPSLPGKKDPVFIFCNTAGNIKGSLNAVSPGGTGPFDFSWYKWSDATKSFSVFLFTQTNVITSTANNLDEGGYRVRITDGGGFNTDLTGWISIDKPLVQASLQNRTCDYVALKGDTATDNFFYKDPADGRAIRLPNKLRFLWSSNPSSSIPYPDFEINPQTFNPPLENVTYKLLVTDSLTCSAESSFLYESIHVKADFTAAPDKGEAPLKVSFIDKSIRGYSYKWEFGDDSVKVYYKSELTDSINHTFYKPGEYSVKLTIESELHCIDSLRFSHIVVEPSSLNIPNVFTPDGDGYNDWFVVDSKSIKFLSMEIFSRSGLKVYGFNGDGDRLKNWTGWDGNINNSSIKASPGIYFYIIRAFGWDDVKYDSKEYRGFLYLYR
jgi:gliding motility-associated-like protein